MTNNKRTPGTSSALEQATGRDRDAWFAALDAWGAAGRPYRQIADWLTGEHHVSKWWAQKLIVEYEQDRGLRDPGARPGGTFGVTASKTVAVPVDQLFEAFTSADVRERWLPGADMRERTSRPGRSARFDWSDDGTLISVDFISSGANKCQVGLEHQRLPDAKAAQEAKVYWRERLDALKALLERGG